MVSELNQEEWEESVLSSETRYNWRAATFPHLQREDVPWKCSTRQRWLSCCALSPFSPHWGQPSLYGSSCLLCRWEHTFLLVLPWATAPGNRTGQTSPAWPQQLLPNPEANLLTKVTQQKVLGNQAPCVFLSRLVMVDVHTWVLLNRTEPMGASTNSLSSCLGRACMLISAHLTPGCDCKTGLWTCLSASSCPGPAHTHSSGMNPFTFGLN